MLKYATLCCSILLFVLAGCDSLQSPNPTQAPKKELLIYCGTAISKALQELANMFEQQEDCTVKIIKEGSGMLYRSIQINQVGDLFLPGCESYIDRAIDAGVVIEDEIIGFNRAVIIVAKNNPLNISAELNNLVSGNYRTIFADPEYASIGKRTKIILQANGLYQQAFKQALYLTTDSRPLTTAIVNNKADLTINWLSATGQANDKIVDILPIENSKYQPILLRIGLLNTAYHPQLARNFMTFTCSVEGQAVLSDYGFGGTDE